MKTTARSVYNYESIKALTHATIYKKKNPKKVFTFINILAAVCALVLIANAIIFGIDKQLIFLLVLAITLVLYNCFLYFAYTKIQYNSLQKMQGIENTFIFEENVIKVSSKGTHYNGEAELEYSMIPKVIETSEYLFIFQSNNQSFIVDKSTVTNGTIDDIKQKLMQNSSIKYILCKY